MSITYNSNFSKLIQQASQRIKSLFIYVYIYLFYCILFYFSNIQGYNNFGHNFITVQSFTNENYVNICFVFSHSPHPANYWKRESWTLRLPVGHRRSVTGRRSWGRRPLLAGGRIAAEREDRTGERERSRAERTEEAAGEGSAKEIGDCDGRTCRRQGPVTNKVVGGSIGGGQWRRLPVAICWATGSETGETKKKRCRARDRDKKGEQGVSEIKGERVRIVVFIVKFHWGVYPPFCRLITAILPFIPLFLNPKSIYIHLTEVAEFPCTTWPLLSN